MITVGQKLRDERIHRKLSLEEVSEATRIQEKFLAAIEKGEYNKLPSAAYAQGFVKNYAQYLGVPKKEIGALFKREFDEEKIYRVLPESLARVKEYPLKGIRVQQSFIIAGIVLIAIAFYLLFQYRYVFIAPPLSLTSPQDTKITSKVVTVSGTTDSNAIVFINTYSVPVNTKGEFTKRFNVFPGKVTITVTAKSRFGKEAVVQKILQVQ